LPLIFSDSTDYDQIEEYDRISIIDLSGLQSGKSVKAVIRKKDGMTHEILLNHTMTEEQIGWFRAGSALNTISDAG